MSKLAVGSLATTLKKVLAQRVIRLVVITDLGSVENMGRQLAGRPETLLLAFRTVEKLAARPVAHAILVIVAEGVLLHGVVLGTLVQVLATLPAMTHVPQEVPADAIRDVGGVRRVCVQSTRHPGHLLLLLLPHRPVAVQLFLQLFHR